MAGLINKKIIIIIVSIIAAASVGVGAFLVVSASSDSDKSEKGNKKKKQETTETSSEIVGDNEPNKNGSHNSRPSTKGDKNDSDASADNIDADKDEANDTTSPESDNIVVEIPDNNYGGSQDKPPVVEQDIPDNTAEIVEYYKNSVNYAKSNGKNAVLVKNGVLNYNNIVQAGSLSSAAESLIGMFMVGSESEIETLNETRAISDIPPAGINCNLTASGVKSATITDNGNTYTVVIVAKDCKNPTPGSDGVGSLVNVVQSSHVTGAIASVPGLELNDVNIDYENVTVTAVIDKSTGGLLSMEIDAPSILSLDAKLAVVTVDDCRVGIQCISEYTVQY